jgi:hypothetical protein
VFLGFVILSASEGSSSTYKAHMLTAVDPFAVAQDDKLNLVKNLLRGYMTALFDEEDPSLALRMTKREIDT